jgi:predicted Fe-Mo cluster-binding NifX family protein
LIVCVPVTSTGAIDPRWGRAARVAVVEVQDRALVRWEEFEVGWDRLHDAASEGGHHENVARFLRDHRIDAVVANHMGDPMVQMLDRMGIDVRLGASGDAGQAILFVSAGPAR